MTKININLTNKSVLITGGTTGIGKATVELFAMSGANVVFCARNQENGDAMAKELSTQLTAINLENQVLFKQADVSDEESIKRLVNFTVSTFGSLDYAVNNAGIRGAVAPIHDITSDDWDSMMDINLKGVFYSLKHEIRQMLAQRENGKQSDFAIVNTSSVYGTGGSALGLGAYHTAKYGVIGLTTTAATEYSRAGIRVNAVCPGWIDIEAVDGMFTEEMVAKIADYHPLGRMGTTDEVARAILFLCSESSSFTTGHSLMVDGGVHAKRDGGLSFV